MKLSPPFTTMQIVWIVALIAAVAYVKTQNATAKKFLGG